MPRTTAVECPGCPPLRALTTDVLGLVKVVEVRGKVGIPKVVETWGSPDVSRSVLAASFTDHETQPLLAVARKNSLVEFLNPLSGVAMATINVGESGSLSHVPEDDPVVGLHLLKTKTTNLSSRLVVFLMCTSKGKVSLRSIESANASDSIKTDSLSTWDVSKAGKVICSSVDARENYALFAGKGIEVNVWDLDKGTKIWTAKPPPSNSLGIFSPTWFNAATFLNVEDQHKIVAGTNDHQLRLYDISAQRRPVVSVNFRESPIKVVTADLDGYTIYVGNGSGDLASFDMRTGKLLGCFVGKCCGSIRSIARHPELPLLASCGLDRYLRLWDTGTRQLLSAVFLKQHLTNVVIDSHFSCEEPTDNEVVPPGDLKVTKQTEVEDDEEFVLASRSKKSRKHEKSKIKMKETQKKVEDDDQTKEVQAHAFFHGEDGDANELPVLKRRKPSSQVKDDRRHKVTSKKRDFHVV